MVAYIMDRFLEKINPLNINNSQISDELELFSPQTDVGPKCLDPSSDLLQGPLGVFVVVADKGAGDGCILPDVQVIDLGYGDVKFPVQPA